MLFFTCSWFDISNRAKTINLKAYGQISCKSAAVAFFCLITLALFPCYSSAQTSGGGYAESYLLRNIGARAISMAGAYTAISNEPSALFYNPAGLGLLSLKPTVSSMYSFLDFGRSHSAISWGQRFTDNLGFGFGINNYNGGSFTARDIRGNSLGNYQDRQISLTGGASYSIEFASVGVGLKYLLNSLEGSGSMGNGFAVDLGTKFNVMDMFTFGLSVQNIAGVMYWNHSASETSILPYTIRTGFATEFELNEGREETTVNSNGDPETIYIAPTRYVMLDVDAVITQHENFPTVTMGVEVVPIEELALRGGIALVGDKEGAFKPLPMTTWGAGVSIRPPLKDLPFSTNIDYTVGSDYLSGSRIAHHVSLLFEF